MNQKVVDGIRANIIEICDGEAQTMQQIIADGRMTHFVARYSKEEISKIVYALVGSGALFVSGRTKAALYVATDNGREFKPIYMASFEAVLSEWQDLISDE